MKWDRLMALGFGVLRLSPDQFWSMTPRELHAALDPALGSQPGAGAPDRSALDALLARFPDNASLNGGRT